MCGVVGYITKEADSAFKSCLSTAVQELGKRGPDFHAAKEVTHHVGFGHARLSIIDTSTSANQPMQDATGRFTIVFNGEIFNFRELKKQFLGDVEFDSLSDTEVLLQLFIRFGKDCLQHLNGFFAFAIYDQVKNEVFLARDRYGIKPLHLYSSKGVVIFASELKAIFKFPIKKELDYSSLLLYLQLNYLPAEYSMIKNTRKLLPGSFAIIDGQANIQTGFYYQVPYQSGDKPQYGAMTYEEAKKTLRGLVEASVSRRLVSDVPLGCFLSGGIDSSIVTACASKQVTGLNTFSIGYADEPFYDETNYARLVADKFNTNHTVFSITSDEMFSHIYEMLNYLDEPFADSSAIAVYMLSKKTRQKVTVALSGDGGDELFAGYNKHRAEALARHGGSVNTLVKYLHPFISLLPQSRHSRFANKFRQLKRYSEGLHLSNAERYWQWCSIQSANNAFALLSEKNDYILNEANNRAQKIKDLVTDGGDLNDVLLADLKMVLPGDMLTKVDLMSMANSLEVRVPLLDYTIVDFAFSLPVEYKLHKGNGKRILKDAFDDVLPPGLFTRPKHGFEVPLAKWIKTGLRPLIEDEMFNDSFITTQGIFNLACIKKIQKDVFANNPGDTPATAWSLIVFQYWYKKYFLS